MPIKKKYKHLSFRSIFVLLYVIFTSFHALTQTSSIKTYFVSTQGNDRAKGTKQHPFLTLSKAKMTVESEKRKGNKAAFEIIVESGHYALEQPLIFHAAESGTAIAPYIIKAAKNAKVIWSGGVVLATDWQKQENGIYKTFLPTVESIPILYGNDRILTTARYPNKQENVYPYGGYAADAVSVERAARWKNPAGGIIHAMHSGTWGGMHYLITGKAADGQLTYEGGWQNNRPSEMHPTQRFVENIFEELDAPGEWFFDKKARMLYYYPLPGEDIAKMQFTAGRLESIIEMKGSSDRPVSHIHIEGIEFKHTAPTFMKTREQLTRSDWAIYRMGAVVLDGTANCSIKNSSFSLLGGNAVFVSNYNRNVQITSNIIEQIGASAIAFVGNVQSVRSPSLRYEEFVPLAQMDRTPGPANQDFPADCQASDNLIRHIGLIEKQVAGVQIQLAARIHVAHNTIYQVPRAGINIGDGAFGGHILEYNDVFETVLETGDHGAFNSWGRDRFWHPDRAVMDDIVEKHPELILLDAVEKTIIRNNRFQCDHGWDIDLDDGSSNYEIYNNLCLSGGLKLREGFHRTVYNNILINNGFHPHVWFKKSHDVFRNNIVMTRHQAIQIPHWGDTVDYNFFVSEYDLLHHQGHGIEQNGFAADPQFANPNIGDFTLKTSSALLGKGFKNFPMNKFGVVSAHLKSKAASPPIRPLIYNANISEELKTLTWYGAEIKPVLTLGEQSAAGLPKIEGLLLLSIEKDSKIEKAGLKIGDVILMIDDVQTNDLTSLLKTEASNRWKGQFNLKIWRNQRPIIVSMKL